MQFSVLSTTMRLASLILISIVLTLPRTSRLVWTVHGTMTHPKISELQNYTQNYTQSQRSTQQSQKNQKIGMDRNRANQNHGLSTKSGL